MKGMAEALERFWLFVTPFYPMINEIGIAGTKLSRK